MSLLLVAGVAALSALLTRALRTWALRRGLLDSPVERSLHTVPTPRLGGVAIVIACAAGWLLVAAGSEESRIEAVALILGGLAAGATGFIDDLRDLPPPAKVAGQICAVLLALELLGSGSEGVRWTENVLAAGMLIAYLNFFNFMDGCDGLAAGVAAISAAALGALALQAGAQPLVPLSLIAAGGALGFLAYNYAPASIFMGDAGSHFLGLTLGVLAIVTYRAGAPWLAVAVTLAPFVFDASFTLVRRAAAGEKLWQAHRSHLYQRLVANGWSHAAVAGLYYGWSGVALCLALVVSAFPHGQFWAAAAACAPGLIILRLVAQPAPRAPS